MSVVRAALELRLKDSLIPRRLSPFLPYYTAVYKSSVLLPLSFSAYRSVLLLTEIENSARPNDVRAYPLKTNEPSSPTTTESVQLSFLPSLDRSILYNSPAWLQWSTPISGLLIRRRSSIPFAPFLLPRIPRFPRYLEGLGLGCLAPRFEWLLGSRCC